MTIIEIAPLIIWLKVSWQSQTDTSGRRISKSKQEVLGKSTPKRRGLEGSEASLLLRNETKETDNRTTRTRTTWARIGIEDNLIKHLATKINNQEDQADWKLICIPVALYLRLTNSTTTQLWLMRMLTSKSTPPRWFRNRQTLASRGHKWTHHRHVSPPCAITLGHPTRYHIRPRRLSKYHMSLKPIDRMEMLNRSKGWQGADRLRATEKSSKRKSHISQISWESRSAKSYLRREQEIKSGPCQNKQVLGPETTIGWMIWSKTKFWCQLLQRNWNNLKKSQKNRTFLAFSA